MGLGFGVDDDDDPSPSRPLPATITEPGTPLAAAQLPGLYKKRQRGGGESGEEEEESVRVRAGAEQGGCEGADGAAQKKLAWEKVAAKGREV